MNDLGNELNNIVASIKSRGKTNFVNAATEEQIATFESIYNINLPLKLKTWLEFSDGGELFLPAGIQLYGVAHKPLINTNDNDRPSDKYIVIGALASGDPILCQSNRETISIYNHEVGRIEKDEVYSDFFAFLNDLYELLGIGD